MVLTHGNGKRKALAGVGDLPGQLNNHLPIKLPFRRDAGQGNAWLPAQDRHVAGRLDLQLQRGVCGWSIIADSREP